MALRFEAQNERRLLAAGATLTLLGIALSAGHEMSLAAVVTLGGLTTLLVGLHRFGRSGPDEPRFRERTRPRSKRRKRRVRAERDSE